MDTSILEEIGLSKREIKVYLALLQIGSTTVGEIIKKTNIPSSKIYEVLNRLQTKGLVSYVIISSSRNYQAAEPKTILNSLEEKQKKLSKLLPLLEAQKTFANRKQSVEIYDGRKAIFAMFNNLISNSKPKEEYLIFSINEEKDDAADLFFKHLSTRRKNRGIKVKLLRNTKNKPSREKRHSKLQIKYTNFDFPEGITIFQDMIVLLSWIPNKTAIKIQSKALASQFNAFFKQIWSEAT